MHACMFVCLFVLYCSVVYCIALYYAVIDSKMVHWSAVHAISSVKSIATDSGTPPSSTSRGPANTVLWWSSLIVTNLVHHLKPTTPHAQVGRKNAENVRVTGFFCVKHLQVSLWRR